MGMAKYKPQRYTEQFTQRTKMLREAAGYESYKDMAKALGLSAPTYYHYETRTCLPHHLIPEFIRLTGSNYQVLFGAPTKKPSTKGNATSAAA